MSHALPAATPPPTPTSEERPPRRLHGVLLLLVLLCAFSFGAIVKASLALDYHTTCVGHGFVSGSDPNDGSFFSRIDAGCGSTYRQCKIYNYGTYIGAESISNDYTVCNNWSRNFGNYTECGSYAKLYFPAAFSEHNHTPNNYCG